MPIWTAKPETAGRVRQRMATVFDFAIAAGWRSDNPCNGALKAALPRRPRQRRHHPALPYTKVAKAIDAIRATPGRDSTKLGLEFLILTAGRAGEVRSATWDEIDAETNVWHVPAAHMKMRRPHRVPLSTGASPSWRRHRSEPLGGCCSLAAGSRGISPTWRSRCCYEGQATVTSRPTAFERPSAHGH